MGVIGLIHGEIAGRIKAAGGGNGRCLRAEGLEHTNPSQLQFLSATPNQDLAGNGGNYYFGGAYYESIAATRPRHVNSNMVYAETLTRFSIKRTNLNTDGQCEIFVCNPRGSTDHNQIMWSLKFQGSELRIDTCFGSGGSRVRRATITGTPAASALDAWDTYWVYARFSSRTVANGYAAAFPQDARLRVLRTDPRTTGAANLLNFSGQIGHHWNDGSHSIYPGGNLRIQNFTDVDIDDVVTYSPSIKFVSATSTLGIAVNDYIRYTDYAGNYIEARVTSAGDAVVVDGKATAEIFVYHMNYYPAGGGAVQRFNGIDWGSGITHPWGTGPVTITDASGTTLGTGTFQYETSTFPRAGVIMPAATPVTSSSPTMTPISGTAADSHLLLDDHGGQNAPSEYVYADAVGEYWQGTFDDPTVSGTDKLTVSGDAIVNGVYTYQWARNDGSGSAVTGEVSTYTLVSGNAFSTRAESSPFTLHGNWGTTIARHPECATGASGTTEPWTVANFNAASFGVVTK